MSLKTYLTSYLTLEDKQPIPVEHIPHILMHALMSKYPKTIGRTSHTVAKNIGNYTPEKFMQKIRALRSIHVTNIIMLSSHEHPHSGKNHLFKVTFTHDNLKHTEWIILGMPQEKLVVNKHEKKIADKSSPEMKLILERLGLTNKQVTILPTGTQNTARKVSDLSDAPLGIGPNISDITIIDNQSKKEYYISLKQHNAGYIYNGKGPVNLVQENGQIIHKPELLKHNDQTINSVTKLFNIDWNKVAQGLKEYTKFGQQHGEDAKKLRRASTMRGRDMVHGVQFNSVKVLQLLKNIIGYGYWYVQTIAGGGLPTMVDMTTPNEAAKFITSIDKAATIAYTGISRKSTNIYINAEVRMDEEPHKKITFVLTFRNKKGNRIPMDLGLMIINGHKKAGELTE